MAFKRFEIRKFASYEHNHMSYPETGRVFAQLPLADEFVDMPAENGEWLVYDYAAGCVRRPTSADEVVMIHFSSEKEYDPRNYGLENFSLKPGGFYPRLGALLPGDLYTTNCFGYDDGEFADNDAVIAALEDIANTPLFLVVEPGQAPKLTATESGSTVAQVVKFYTVPNGEPGIKVMFTKVA